MPVIGCCMFILGGALLPGAPVVLENPQIRIELEPRTFSLRYLGFPGGKNFLESVYLSESQLATGGWLEPGGITSDLAPLSRENVGLRRGPATVVEQRDDYLLLLGPVQPGSGWQFKKEYQLASGAAALTYKLTVLSPRIEERAVGVRVTAQLPWAGSLVIPRAFGNLGLLRGASAGLAEIMAQPGDAYVIPVAAHANWNRVVVEAPSPEVLYRTSFGLWARRMEIRSATADPDPGTRYRLLALIDDDTHTYQVALEAAQSGVNVGAPMVVVEHWTLTLPAKEELENMQERDETLGEIR